MLNIIFQYVVLFCFVFSSFFNSTEAQEGKDNKGRHFIFGFMDNELVSSLEIFITTSRLNDVEVNITTPLFDSSVFKSINVQRNLVSKFNFNVAVRGMGTELSNKGIEILSSDEITVFAVNKHGDTTDALVLFPTNAIGQTYYIVNWNKRSAFMIIATEADTTVNITMGSRSSVLTYKAVSYSSGMSLHLHLDQFETFHAQGHETSDFTGTLIETNKPVAVLSGSKCNNIGGGACDHLVSQLTSLENFGKRFITIYMPHCNRPSHYKIVSSEFNTQVNISGIPVATLSNPGEYFTLGTSGYESKIITLSEPALVAFFSEGNCGSPSGDPAMILLPPVEQYSSDYTFATVDIPEDPFQNYLTIVINTNTTGDLVLDGGPLPPTTWKTVQGTDQYVITSLRINEGSHTIYHRNPTVTFLAVSTGLAEYNSYGYSAGQRLSAINSNCSLTKPNPGDIIDNDCDGRIDEELLDGLDNDGDLLVDEDTAVFFIDQLTTSSVVEVITEDKFPTIQESSNLLRWALIAILPVIGIALIMCIVYVLLLRQRRRKKKEKRFGAGKPKFNVGQLKQKMHSKDFAQAIPKSKQLEVSFTTLENENLGLEIKNDLDISQHESFSRKSIENFYSLIREVPDGAGKPKLCKTNINQSI